MSYIIPHLSPPLRYACPPERKAFAPAGGVMPGRNYTSASGYRYGFNGMEKDDEVKGSNNSLDFGARIYDPRVGRWMSTDPQFKKYPEISPYSFAGDNPIYFVDPDGETLRVAGHVIHAVQDLQSIVPEQYRAAISVTNDGSIYIDASKIATSGSESPTDAGMVLLNQMVGSENNYEYRVANDNNGTPLHDVNGTTENNSITPKFVHYPEGDNLPEGIDGQVIIAKDAKFTAKNGQEENRASVVFHELQENYERTDNKLPYAYPSENRDDGKSYKKGAHQTAIDKSSGLTPSAKSVSGTEGELKDAELK